MTVQYLNNTNIHPKQEYIMFILNIINQAPGHYTRPDLIKQVRMHGIESRHEDPGRKTAKSFINELINHGYFKMASPLGIERIIGNDGRKRAFPVK